MRWFGSHFKGILSRYKQCKKYPMSTYLVNAAFSKWWLFTFFYFVQFFFFLLLFCCCCCCFSCSLIFFFVSIKYILLWVRLFIYAYKTKLEKTKCLAWKPFDHRLFDTASNGTCQCVCCVCVLFFVVSFSNENTESTTKIK